MDNKAKKKYSNYKQKSTDKSKAMLVQRDQPESTSVSINLRDLNFNTVRGIKSKGELKVWNTRDLPIIHNTYSPLHKDSMNSPNEDADEKNSTIFLPNYPQNEMNINSKNDWSKVKQNESYNARQKSAYNFDSKKINDKTPSFSSIIQNISQSNEDNDQDESNSICGLSSQTFSDSTKLIIDKELLNNIRQVSSQLLAIKDSFKKYKEYYKLEVLEQQFIILNSLLQDSFNRAFAQIVDLSVWNSDKNLDTSMNDTSNLKEYKYKYKKLKNLYKDKVQEIQDIQSIFTKERAELVNILKSKEKDLTDAFSRHTKSLNQESDSSQGTLINPIDIEIHSFKERIVKLENEREQARFYAKELEEELEQTKSVLKNNQTNLIEPLKNRLWELEQCIQNKEDKVRRNYRRKLKKWRKELENEKKINISLAKRICLINPDDRPASAFDYRNSKNERSRFIEKNQSRSIIDLNRSRQGYNQFETQINLK